MNVEVKAIEDRVTTVVVEPTSAESETPVTLNPRVEEFRFSRETLITFFKQLVHQGDNRYLVIRDQQGQTLLEFPLLIAGVGLILGAFLFPIAAVVGAIAVFGANLTLVVERKEQ